MDSAALHIKFHPLIKQLQFDSNCYIEVLPEISQITNLDKINWSNNDEEIEFNIPIMYKIIIKKCLSQDYIKNEQLDKVYHSCVDLLHTDTNDQSNRLLSNNFLLENIKCNTKLMKQLVALSNNNNILALINKDDDKKITKPDENRTLLCEPDIQNQELSLETIIPNTVMNPRVCENTVQRTRDNGDFHERASNKCLHPDLKITKIDKEAFKLELNTNRYRKPTLLSPIHENTLNSDSQNDKLHHQHISYLNDIFSDTIRVTSYKMNDNVPFRIELLVNYMKNEIMPFNRTLNEIVAKCNTESMKLKKKMEKLADEKRIRACNINNNKFNEKSLMRFSTTTNRICLNVVYNEG